MKNLLSALARCVRGPIYIPEDSAYSSEIQSFNTTIVHTPQVVVCATSSMDIVESVRLAREYGYAITVQATGHGAQTPVRSGMLISTRRMDSVSIDTDTHCATIAAGTRWRSVVAAAAKYDLAPIAGASMDVGVIGYILGGGLGPLARSHGFSSDYLLGLTVVTAYGELLEVNATQHSELFWALRGGKNGLGIVTEIKLRLIKLKMLYAGSLYFEEQHIETVLRTWADWTNQADLRVTSSVAIIQTPNNVSIPEKIRGRRLLQLRFAYPGLAKDGQRLAAPLRSSAPIYIDLLGEIPASQMGRIHNDPAKPGPVWTSCVLLNYIDQDFISLLLDEIGTGKDTPFVATEIRHIGGATHYDVAAGSAVGGRAAKFTFGLVGSDPQQYKDILSTKTDTLMQAMAPWICEEGNINFIGTSNKSIYSTCLWPRHIYKRLEEVRKKYATT